MAPRPTSAATPTAAAKPNSTLSPRRPSISLLSRNVDTVVLGNVQFDTWYYSPYSDGIIFSAEAGAAATVAGGGGGDDESLLQKQNGWRLNGAAVAAAAVAASPSSPFSPAPRTTKATTAALCPALYVCPLCFRYTPHISRYVAHLQFEQRLRSDHPKLPPVPESATPVYSYDGYCVWEVDGETEKLYCQNLSLFGKLFLEQKSVFFDTGGFLYYVLTYTQPSLELQEGEEHGYGVSRGGRNQPSGRMGGIRDDIEHAKLTATTEVLGFFSKENPSWDSNNLACILIFPPYQHRQLGKLLMSVSYKLSGWEWEGGIIGGPEKPLSVMGRRSYHRFWSERVARFILGESTDADGRKVLDEDEEETHEQQQQQQQDRMADNATGKRRKRNEATMRRMTETTKKEAMTVKEIGERTGMLAEDVVAALTEMGVCEHISPVPPPRPPLKKVNTENHKSSDANRTKKSGEANGHRSDVASSRDADREREDAISATMVVRRSRVVDWARRYRVGLHDPVREEGFLGEWAMSDGDADGDADADADADADMDVDVDVAEESSGVE